MEIYCQYGIVDTYGTPGTDLYNHSLLRQIASPQTDSSMRFVSVRLEWALFDLLETRRNPAYKRTQCKGNSRSLTAKSSMILGLLPSLCPSVMEPSSICQQRNRSCQSGMKHGFPHAQSAPTLVLPAETVSQRQQIWRFLVQL